MIWSATVLYATLAALAVQAAPTQKLAKRHSHCWSTNVEGCQYDTVGKNGAVATVSSIQMHGTADSSQEVGTCSEIGIDILQQGGNAADGEWSKVS